MVYNKEIDHDGTCKDKPGSKHYCSQPDNMIHAYNIAERLWQEIQTI